MARVDESELREEEISEEVSAAAVPPEIVANSLGDYAKAWWVRLRAGESGMLPVIVGLIIISVIFQSLNSKFLTAGNLTNLMVQGAVFVLLAAAEIWVLLLGEIDLSAGFVAGVCGVIVAEQLKPGTDWPWYAAVGAGLGICLLIGLFQGSLITRIGLPSFVVTLAGLLGWQGVMLKILGNGGTLPIQNDTVNKF